MGFPALDRFILDYVMAARRYITSVSIENSGELKRFVCGTIPDPDFLLRNNLKYRDAGNHWSASNNSRAMLPHILRFLQSTSFRNPKRSGKANS